MDAEGQEAAPKAKRRRSVGNLGGVAAYGFYRSVEWKLAVPTLFTDAQTPQVAGTVLHWLRGMERGTGFCPRFLRDAGWSLPR